MFFGRSNCCVNFQFKTSKGQVKVNRRQKPQENDAYLAYFGTAFQLICDKLILALNNLDGY